MVWMAGKFDKEWARLRSARVGNFGVTLCGGLLLFALGPVCLALSSNSRAAVEVQAQEHGTEPDLHGAPPEGSLSNAKKLIAQGKLTEAEADLRGYVAQHKESAMAHTLLGLVKYKQNKPAESLLEFSRAAQLSSPRFSELVIVSLDYVKLRDLTSADRWMSVAVKKDPNSAGAWRYLGGIKYSENQFADAIDAYRKCLQLRPQDILSEDGIGHSLEGLGRDEEAAAAYRQAIDWQQHEGVKAEQPFLHLGALLLHQGNAQAALPYLRHAEELSVSDADVHQALGESYLQINQLPDAQAELEKAVALSPRDSHLHWLLASVYRRERLVEKEHEQERLFSSMVGSRSNDHLK